MVLRVSFESVVVVVCFQAHGERQSQREREREKFPLPLKF